MKQQQIVNSIRDGIAYLKMLGPIQGTYAFGKLADKIQYDADVTPEIEICAYVPQSSTDPNWNPQLPDVACLVLCLGDILITTGYWPGGKVYNALGFNCGWKPKWLYGQTPVKL